MKASRIQWLPFVQRLLCSGVALCAMALSSVVAQANAATSLPSTTLFVDCAANAKGNGTAAWPYWRITDALDRARTLRRGTSRPIVIRVAAGICSGNFEPQPTEQGERPPELLPLMLNVSDLTLHGAGVMDHAKGFPIAMHSGTATTLTVDTEHLGALDNTVIYVGPTTDGGRADGTTIEGMWIDDQFNSWLGIYVNRTQRVTVRNTVVEHLVFTDIICSECSGRFVGNVMHDGTPGLVVAGGTPSNPSHVFIGGNTATNNAEGLLVFGDSMYTEVLDMGANPITPLPYAINPTAGEVGTSADVEIAGNDVSNNYGDGGLKFSILGGGRYPYARTGNINAWVHDNRFIDNSGFPFDVNEGFVFRGNTAYWTNPDPNDFPVGYLGSLAAPFITHGPFDGPYSGTVNAVLDHNVWSNPTVTPSGPAILTFSYIDVYDAATGEPDPSLVALYTYMHNSRLNIVDRDGLLGRPGVVRDDLRLFDPLDGVTPLNNRTRIYH